MEEQSKIDLVRAEKEYQKQERGVEDLKSRLQEIEQNFVQQESMSPNDLWLWRNYRDWLMFDIDVARDKLKELEKKVNENRKILESLTDFQTPFGE